MTYDDRDTVCQKGKFRLEEWEDVNYCEHCFYNGDEPLEDEKVVILLSDLTTENEQLKKENYELHNRLGDFKSFERYMKERTSKTSVNDIIGLVKTDEPTNSVQLKKEAQLSICEKRIMELEKENLELQDYCARFEEKVLKIIDMKIEEIKPYNSELCRRVLHDLKMELKQ